MNNDAISKVPWSLVCHIFSEISLVGWSLLKLQCETIDSFFISYRYRIIIGRSPGKCKCPKKKVKVFYENETWRSSRTLRTKSSWPNSKEDFLSFVYPCEYKVSEQKLRNHNLRAYLRSGIEWVSEWLTACRRTMAISLSRAKGRSKTTLARRGR